MGLLGRRFAGPAACNPPCDPCWRVSVPLVLCARVLRYFISTARGAASQATREKKKKKGDDDARAPKEKEDEIKVEPDEIPRSEASTTIGAAGPARRDETRGWSTVCRVQHSTFGRVGEPPTRHSGRRRDRAWPVGSWCCSRDVRDESRRPSGALCERACCCLEAMGSYLIKTVIR